MRFFVRILDDFFQFSHMREFAQELGWWRFGLTVFVTISYIGIWFWLPKTVEWPNACDPDGIGPFSWLENLRCSPGMLTGGASEIVLFIWMWMMPVGILLAIGWRLVWEFRKR